MLLAKSNSPATAMTNAVAVHSVSPKCQPCRSEEMKLSGSPKEAEANSRTTRFMRRRLNGVHSCAKGRRERKRMKNRVSSFIETIVIRS